MGPLLALVALVSGKNVIVTCKVVSFTYSLDNFLLKNVIVFIFEIHILEWRPFEKKRATSDLYFTFSSHQGKDRKIPSAHILHKNTKLTLMTLFSLTNFEKKFSYTVSL